MASTSPRYKLPVIYISILLLALVGCTSQDLIASPIPAGEEIASALPLDAAASTPDLSLETPNPPTPTIPPSLTPEPPTPTITSTLTSTPTRTATATASPTPMAVGSDLIRFWVTKSDSETPWKIYSLQEDGLVDRIPQPAFDVETEAENTSRTKITLVDGSGSLIKTIYECPAELVEWCMPIILAGRPGDEWIHLAILPSLSGEPLGSDLVTYNQKTGETKVLEQFDAFIDGFRQFPGSSAGLLATIDNKLGKSFLYLYDLQTLEKKLVIRDNWGLCGYGFLPDLSTFWYRICDVCETRFVREDSTRIPSIKASDGIIGWIDESHFLIFTTGNNAPICTRTGIAVAITSGLTGEMIVQGVIGQAALSRDRTKLIYTTDCRGYVCKQLVVLDLTTNETRILFENEEGIYSLSWVDE